MVRPRGDHRLLGVGCRVLLDMFAAQMRASRIRCICQPDLASPSVYSVVDLAGNTSRGGATGTGHPRYRGGHHTSGTYRYTF
jgi:hypothetical protein